MKKIGIVGLGIMGRGMAVNFIKDNYEVFVWNRTRETSEGVEGASVCDSPEEVAEKADIVFEVTANDESSKDVWTGDFGILAGADEDTQLIISSTVSIEWTDELIELCNEKSLNLLDIPLTGGRVGAETGNMTLLCGGKEELIEELKPTFNSIAGNIFYFGPSGHGMRYKLILNFLQGTHIVAFGQAMKMANEQGMDLKKVGDGLAFRPGGVVTEIANKTYFEKPDPITFSIDWITKDLTYAREMAENLNVSVLDATLEEYKKVLDDHRNDDWARVNNLLTD